MGEILLYLSHSFFFLYLFLWQLTETERVLLTLRRATETMERAERENMINLLFSES